MSYGPVGAVAGCLLIVAAVAWKIWATRKASQFMEQARQAGGPQGPTSSDADESK